MLIINQPFHFELIISPLDEVVLSVMALGGKRSGLKSHTGTQVCTWNAAKMGPEGRRWAGRPAERSGQIKLL